METIAWPLVVVIIEWQRDLPGATGEYTNFSQFTFGIVYSNLKCSEQNWRSSEISGLGEDSNVTGDNQNKMEVISNDGYFSICFTVWGMVSEVNESSSS